MSLSDSKSRYITIGLIIFVILGLVIASVMGKKQDEAFKMDNALYSQAVQKMQKRDYVGALETSSSFKNNQSTSEAVNYLIGISAANVGNLDSGLIHMQRTLDINPYKVENSIFMLQYAEILIIADRVEDALKVLKRCETLSVPETYPQYKERVAELQNQLGIES